MSRTLPTRAGLKKNKLEGELTLPFDLAIHRYDAVCDLIRSDFDDYTNPKYLELDNGVIRHKKYFVRYTHEKSQKFSDDNFKYLVEKYDLRVENFKKYISENNVLFVSTFPLYPLELFEVIKNKYPKLNFKIVNFDTRPFLSDTEIYRSQAFIEYNPQIIYIRSPVPSEDYIWWKEECYNSRQGKDFESYINYHIKSVVEVGLNNE